MKINPLRRAISRVLMQTRIALFGNNHSALLNYRYRSYLKAAQKQFRPTRKAQIDSAAESIAKFRREGFLVMPSALTPDAAAAMRQKVDTLFDSSANVFKVSNGMLRLIDGVERLPEVIDLLNGPISDVVEGYFGSHYKLYTASFYRTVPDESTPASSFLWHFDNAPDEELKLMIYLDEVTNDTGAFRFKDLQTSERARALGFWHRDDYAKAEAVFNDPSTTIVAEGGTGTAVLFRQGRVVHKATAPNRAHRDVVTMHIIPSLIPWREHFARNRHLLSTNAGLCRNPWTDEPENIGYRY